MRSSHLRKGCLGIYSECGEVGALGDYHDVNDMGVRLSRVACMVFWCSHELYLNLQSCFYFQPL